MMKTFDCTKGKNYFFALSAVLIVAGIICALAFGGELSGSKGYDIYTADISSDFTFDDTVTTDDVAAAAVEISKADTAEVIMGYTSGSDLQLRIEARSPFELDTDSVKEQLNAEFEGLGLGDFSSSKLSENGSAKKWLTLLIAFAVMLVAVWIVAIFAAGFAVSYYAVIAVAHDVLITLAFFMFLRVGDVRALVACGAGAAAFSAYFNISELMAINEYVGKGGAKQAAISAFERNRESLLTFAVFALVIAAAFAVAALCMGETAVIPFALLLFVSLVSGVYSSCCVMPNLLCLNK